MPLSRQTRSMSTDRTSTPRANQAKERCETRLIPNRGGPRHDRIGRVGKAGAERLVDAGDRDARSSQDGVLHEDGKGERRDSEEESRHTERREPDQDGHDSRHRPAVEHHQR